MARKTARGRRGVNKSEQIRNYLKKHRNAKPKQIIAGLGAQGIDVSAALVSSIKYAKSQGKGRKKAARKARARRNSVTVDQLLKAKQLAEQLGGVDRARTALEALRKLT